MRIVFMGSPAFAVPALKALHGAGHEIVAVYTQPPRPAGRGNTLTPTPVHQAAQEMGLPVHHPDRLQGDALEALLALAADAICVVGYGLLLPKQLVDARLCLNVHPSALPRWRGASPVQSALLAGDTSTDVCIMKLDEGMDTGPVYDRTPLEIPPTMTARELNAKVWPLGAERLVHVLANLKTLNPIPQQGDATHAPKLTTAMRRVDFAQPARAVHNHIRAFSPTPAATMQIGTETVKLLRSEVVEESGTHGAPGEILNTHGALHLACGQGVIGIQQVQRPGKTPMDIQHALNGWKIDA